MSFSTFGYEASRREVLRRSQGMLLEDLDTHAKSTTLSRLLYTFGKRLATDEFAGLKLLVHVTVAFIFIFAGLWKALPPSTGILWTGHTGTHRPISQCVRAPC